MAVIECKDVGIRYKTGNFRGIGLKEYIMKRATSRYEVNEVWADKHINFALEKWEMLGIIGTNGAGKSTLLKAVTGIMLPAEGSLRTRGSIAAFLELATGFDPEMTIRENTYLRGAMLGYTRAFMLERYDSILEFAGLTEFQDYTFKQLSSGMKSRLAFAIAAQVDPDILILDEVLSVGDGAFRKKSGDKMREILSAGVTGVLVSHSISQIRELCNKVLWIDHGHQITFSDDVELYCDAYEAFLRGGTLPPLQGEDGHAEQVARLAADQRAYKEELAAKGLEETDRISEMTKEQAVATAIRILQEHQPDALNKQLRSG